MWVGQIMYVSSKKMIWQHLSIDVYDDSSKQMMKHAR